MPDKTGAFLLASRIIAKHHGNITRVSYNKAVDLHTLFIDVAADRVNLEAITEELERVGYLKRSNPEIRVIVVEIKVPDQPGAILPVLKVLDRYDINISYLNSCSNYTPYQHFKMGLLIENPAIIKMVSESNRIMQALQEKGESPAKVFDYIRSFAYFISQHRGDRFQVEIERVAISATVVLYSIQPPCGSNTVIFDTQDELVLIDTGYASYADEMFAIFRQLFPDWETRRKKVYITHADVDHCGLLKARQH